MIHFVTVHFHSERWIDIQLRNIARHTDQEYRIWACLNGIDPAENAKFHRVFDLEGEHPEKLNVLAERVAADASPDDLLVFIDGDAFPIDAWIAPITALMERYPLVAVQRLENLGDPQPHPLFCVTTVRFWQRIGGDWTRGGEGWVNETGRVRRDAGGRVLEKLKELNIEWYPLLRSNKRDLHPVLFGVYADLVYHHGSAFRVTRTIVDRHIAGQGRWTGPGAPAFVRPIAPLVERLVKLRLRRRERRNLKHSIEVFDEISRDDDYIRRFFLGHQPSLSAADRSPS